MTSNFSTSDAQRFLELLARPGDVFELRGLSKVNGQQHVTSGYFDDVGALLKAAADRSGRDHGVYVTINPVNPALLARAPKNQVRRAGNGDTTSDRDVRTRRSILIDIDPVRPAGISSSEYEHHQALKLAEKIKVELDKHGWPDPIFADSGNGAHLIYAVDLPVDDGGLVKRVLERLSRTYSTPELKVDEKVFNPARISKIYGTLTRKGESTTDRPHRLARIIEAPPSLYPVPVDMLEQFAGPAPAARPASTNGTRPASSFDLDAWISEHLPDAQPQAWSEGRKWLIPVCPFNSEHDRKEAFIVEKHSGQIAAGCQHESCFSTWAELREHFEPGHRERRAERERQYANGHHPNAPREREHAPEVVYQAADYRPPPTVIDPPPAKPPWWRGPDLAAHVWEGRNDPWISLNVHNDELCRVRVGGTVVVMGGSGSGKSSLVSNLLIHHAVNKGPAIALSIELPADELAARIVGIRCDASWEQALRGQVRLEFMQDALNLPRLYVIERKFATIENLAKCAAFVKKEHPGEPILAAIDYAQLISSKEKEVRLRVADAFERIDEAARSHKFVAIAVSQMSRASASLAATGEKIGAETASMGAESAAIERFASITMSIGKKGEQRGDGSAAVELNIGKGRMSDMGDRVIPMSYFGRSGLWQVAGEAKSSAELRQERDTEKNENRSRDIANLLVGAAHRSTSPMSREQLQGMIPKGSKKERLAMIATLVASGELVEVGRTAPRSKNWMVWTVDRARDAGTPLVRDAASQEAGNG